LLEALRAACKAEVLALLAAGDETPPASVDGAQAPGTDTIAYAFPWSDWLPAFGSRTVGPFEPCANCGARTFVQYGQSAHCLKYARARASRDPEPGR
jgi:hypothetical protein